MKIKSPAGNEYSVGKLLGETERFKLYQCLLGDGSEGILKITAQSRDNPILDREAFLLKLFKETAQCYEKEFAKTKKDDTMLNYHFFFPELIECFIDKDQEGRRISILSLMHISKQLGDLVPLSQIREKEHLRVDPKTSAWILGKLLKLLDFVHGQGIAITNLSGENILINREQHYVAVFDWTEAMVTESVLNEEEIATEISLATEAVITLLDGNPETGAIPEDEQLSDSSYQDFLKQLLDKKETDAFEAHKKFYALIWSLWPREFYPYTTHRISK
jgi:serine/threonine protein kinase